MTEETQPELDPRTHTYAHKHAHTHTRRNKIVGAQFKRNEPENVTEATFFFESQLTGIDRIIRHAYWCETKSPTRKSEII